MHPEEGVVNAGNNLLSRLRLGQCDEFAGEGRRQDRLMI